MVGLRCVILDFMEFTSFPSLLCLLACLLAGEYICADWFVRLHTVSEWVDVICRIDLLKKELEEGGGRVIDETMGGKEIYPGILFLLLWLRFWFWGREFELFSLAGCMHR